MMGCSFVSQAPATNLQERFAGGKLARGTGVLAAKRLAGQAHIVEKQAAVIDWRVSEKFGAATPNAEEFRELSVWSLNADAMQRLPQGEHHSAGDAFSSFLT